MSDQPQNPVQCMSCRPSCLHVVVDEFRDLNTNMFAEI